MEKQTRVQKYKDLREEMKEEVAINRHIDEVVQEDDDDFLAFLPKEEKKNVEDTLMEPLSYEMLDADSHVRHALNEAKVNVGKEQFNTRLDILSKIKQEEKEYEPAHEYQQADLASGHVVNEEPKQKMSLLEKLAAMSPEEDAQELKKFEEGMTVADLMSSQKPKQEPVQKPKVEKVVQEIEEDDDEEEESRFVNVLNYVIIALIVVFIVLIGFMVKQMFF